MTVRAGSRGTTRLLVRGLAAAAAALTAYQLTRPGLLLGPTPDIGVYLGAAVRLVHGAVPYRDYVFVQPPGFVLLAAPFGLLSEAVGTRDALMALRLLTPLLAAANVLLVGRLVRHRGVGATLVACAVMACYPAEMYATRGPQLEPVADLLGLVGLACVFEGDGFAVGRRRLAWGGAALGLAVAVKLSAAIPIVALLLVCAAATRRRALPAALGATASLAAVCLPFVGLAPAAALHDTIATQLERVPAATRVPLLLRLAEVTGLSEIGAGGRVLLAFGAAIVLLVIVAFVAARRRPTALETVAVLATVALALAQLAPSQYFAQYAALLAPFLAILLGLSVARLAEAVTPGRAIASCAGLACVLLLGAQALYVGHESVVDDPGAIDAAVPVGACVLSNRPVLLVTADRFQSTVRGCTVMTDPSGTTLALADDPAGAVRTWRAAFEHVDYLVADVPIGEWDVPAVARIPAYVASTFTLTRSGGLYVYSRRGVGRCAQHTIAGTVC